MNKERKEDDITCVLLDKAMKPFQHFTESIEPDEEENDATLEQPFQENIMGIRLLISFH